MPRDKYDEAVQVAAATMESIGAKDPADPGAICGPVISAVQRDRVEDYLRIAVEEGGTFATGGHVIDRDGFWIEPTVVAGLDNSSRLAQEEIFGPVLVVIPHDGDDDAVRIANESAYGLSGSVDSGDLERARAVARRIRTGTLAVNGGVWFSPDAPFGGYKQSGIGREMGVAGFEEYLETKTIGRAGSRTLRCTSHVPNAHGRNRLRGQGRGRHRRGAGHRRGVRQGARGRGRGGRRGRPQRRGRREGGRPTIGGGIVRAHRRVVRRVGGGDGRGARSAAYGGIDLLVNNAAIYGDMQFDLLISVDWDYYRKFMSVNMDGALVMTRACYPQMQARGGGSIVNQSSTAAYLYSGFYGLAKVGINGLTQQLAHELGGMGIRVNAIAPGPDRHRGHPHPGRRRRPGAGQGPGDQADGPARGHGRRLPVPALRRGGLGDRPDHRGRRRTDLPPMTDD